MLPTEATVAFFTASFLLALAPGPDNLFVLMQSALHGRAAGAAVTLGLCTGLIVHTAAVAIGVAALVQASSVAFTALKLAGVGYLLYLAWRALAAEAVAVDGVAERRVDLPALYRRGIVMNVTNPKVSLFFLAFLPQFVDPQRGAAPPQIAALGLLFILATAIVFGAVAVAAGTLRRLLVRDAGVQVALNRIAAAVFVALACRLAVAKR